MEKIFAWIIMTLLAATSASAAPQPGKQTGQSFKKEIRRSVSADYLLFLPAEYDAKRDEKWPLLLFLHGAGERGSDLELVTKHGPPKIVRDQADFKFVVVSPQCPTGQRWDSETLLALLDEVQEKHRIDPNRVYLTGLSMGGFGTWSLGLAHPDRFAAIAPICGGGDPIAILLADPARREYVKTLPVWAFHGAKDPVVKLENSQRLVDALKKIGNPAKLTVYPEAGHDSWTETYDNQDLYDWFLSHNLKDRRPEGK